MMENKFYADIITTYQTADQLHRAYLLMSEERRQRCDNMRFDDEKRACICADMLIRRLVERQTGLSPEGVEICTDELGKPFVKNADCHISISHCRNFVMAAVSPYPIGVDIEKIATPPKNILNHIALDIANDEEFYRLWTTAESYGKLWGKGVWWALKEYDAATGRFKGDEGCRFEPFPCPEGFVATVCIKD